MQAMETFVVRLWVPGGAAYAAEPSLRGFVMHPATGREDPFVGPEELLAFFEDATQKVDSEPLVRPADERQPA
jgi:hypothetical protein